MECEQSSRNPRGRKQLRSGLTSEVLSLGPADEDEFTQKPGEPSVRRQDYGARSREKHFMKSELCQVLQRGQLSRRTEAPLELKGGGDL